MGYALRTEAPHGAAKVEAPYKSISSDELRRGEHMKRVKEGGRAPELGPSAQGSQKATLRVAQQPAGQPTTAPQPVKKPEPPKSQPPKGEAEKKRGKQHDPMTPEGHNELEREAYRKGVFKKR